MAKANSKNKTIEDALVPVEEQPYKVPGNWCWIHLLDSFDNVTDSKKKLPTKEYQEEGKFSIIDQGQNFVGGFTNREDMIYDGNLPVVIFGDHTRCMKYVDFPFVQGADGVKVLRPKIFWDSKAFYYALQSVEIPNMGYRRHYPLFKNFSIPLPPIPEQQRIVFRIESLYSQLDEAKDKAQEVIDGFDSRRAAILAQAFSGKLTEKWREENAIKNSWGQKRFDEVAEIKSNLVDPAEFQEFPHIAPDNIEKRTGVLLEYHTIAHDGVTSGKHRFYPGQILYSKIRPYLSKVVMVDFDGLCSADMYPIEAKQNTKFLWYYMLSDEFLEAASSAGSRSVLPKINQKELSKIPVRITESDYEQGEVVRILDEIFAKENEARILAETVVDKIEEIKKSVLAKAFRGELGTQDSSDEPAEELLKRILTEAPVEEKKKSTTRKKKVKVVMNKDLLEAVREAGKITPERLKEETGLGIDEFYEELKRLTESGQVSEKKEGGDVYLEVGDADR